MNTTALYISLFVFLCSFIPATNLLAQDQLQVASKEIVRNYLYGLGTEVTIIAEKAEIQVTAWAKDEIEVRLTITSQHPDKQIAADNLQYMRYEMVEENRTVRLSSSIKKTDGQLPEAHLSAHYDIRIPANCPLVVRNIYGRVMVSHLKDESDIKAQFSEVILNDLSGNTLVNTYYGNLFTDNVSGRVRIMARHTDMKLNNMNGFYDIQAAFCKMQLLAGSNLQDLFVDATRSDVSLDYPDLGVAKYTIAVQHGQIYAAEQLELRYLDKTSQYTRVRYLDSPELPGVSVRISVNYGDVRIH